MEQDAFQVRRDESHLEKLKHIKVPPVVSCGARLTQVVKHEHLWDLRAEVDGRSRTLLVGVEFLDA